MEKFLVKYLGSHYANVIFTNIFGASILAFLFFACINLGGESLRTQIIYAVGCLIGLLLGWAVAIYFTPFGADEQTKLVTLGQAASAFASGYLVSKLDRFIETTLFPKEGTAANEWLGIALFITAFLNALTVVYSNRTYFQEQDKKDSALITRNLIINKEKIESKN